MRLYATVSSERASKGQGGKELEIIITGEKGQKVFTMNVSEKGGDYLVEYKHAEGFNLSDDMWWIQKYTTERATLNPDLYETKGEKQKGECEMHGVKHCIHCTENPYSTI